MSHKPSRNFSHLRKFRLLEPVREPATKPKAGFEYLFEAENSKKISGIYSIFIHFMILISG